MKMPPDKYIWCLGEVIFFESMAWVEGLISKKPEFLDISESQE
jgi:hypothetical protein